MNKRQQWVYFIKPAGMDGPIKIGCSVLPKSRLENLMVWAPYPLEIIGSIPGSFAIEQMIHRKFADLHSHCEWFNTSPELIEAIRIAIETGSADHIEAMPGGRSIKSKKKELTPDRRLYLSYSARVRVAENKLRAAMIAAWYAPADVCAIIKAWDYQGYYRDRQSGRTPSPAEFARLDEYLANPGAHSVIPEWQRHKVAA